MTEIETGTLAGRFGYLRIAGGPRTLVLLPGLALDNEPPGGLVARAYAHGFRALTATHTLHVIRRPRGLPDGTTIADLAAEHAALVRAEFGRADVLGLSTGGLVAQELALGAPDVVDRLLLVVSGARIAPPGRALSAEWLDLAAGGDWRGLRGALAAVAVDGRVAQRLARLLVRRASAPAGTDAADFVTTVHAVLAHDTTERLGGLEMPALLVGGAQDPFFPEDVLRSAAGPTMRLHVHAGSGHGLPKHHGGRVMAELARFLAEETEARG